MLPATAKQAREAGERLYFTGKPCPKGHIAPRAVGNRGCTTCDKAITNEYCKRKYQENIVQEKEYRRQHYLNNKEAYKAAARRQRQEGYAKTWYSRNKGRWNAHVAARMAAKDQRTPKWSETELIEQFYKNCPQGYTVDHVIPLRGKQVSGLHVIANLQYLTKSQNSQKNNTFDPELYTEQG